MKDGIQSRLLACLAVVVLVCLTMFAIGKTVNIRQEPVAGVKMILPDEILGWQGRPARVSQQEKEILGEDTEFARKFYVSPSGREGFLLSIVLSGKDRTSIHPPEMCLVGQGWQLTTSEVVPVDIRMPRAYRLNVMKLEGYSSTSKAATFGGKKKLLYLYWFVGKDLVTPDKKDMTFRESWDRITRGVSHRWAYVTLAAITEPGEEAQTLRLMKIFLESAVPRFQIVVPSK